MSASTEKRAWEYALSWLAMYTGLDRIQGSQLFGPNMRQLELLSSLITGYVSSTTLTPGKTVLYDSGPVKGSVPIHLVPHPDAGFSDYSKLVDSVEGRLILENLHK
eukprot:14916680-Heterocapsa_arctica.AAC.1